MNDPHVETLLYQLRTSERVNFDKAAPLKAKRQGFAFTIDTDDLTVTMDEHYATESAAREAVEPILRAWEIHHALWAGSREISFAFDRSVIVDRDPPPPPKPGEPHVVHVVGAAAMAMASASASVLIGRGQYPEPPLHFAVDPDTETLWDRWTGYQEGREPLQSMAYFCKTVVERQGGERAAAQRLAISRNVLETIGKLASMGDATTARKASALRPLTSQEQAWLEAAVKELIRRSGEVAAAPTAARPTLTMDQLPPLSTMAALLESRP
jgi:hypothetical protein